MATTPSRQSRKAPQEQLSADGQTPPEETPVENEKPGYLAKLESRTREAEQRIRAKAEEDENKAAQREHERKLIQLYSSNTTIRTRAAAVEAEMMRLEGQGLFAQFPIRTDNKFPTLLTRLPIFPPSQRVKQLQKAGVESAIEFGTPFGSGRRIGPMLTTKEEDVLIALLRLRDRRIWGRPESLPGNIPDIYAQNEAGKIGVHVTICSMTELLDELELTDGGPNFKDTFASVKRLGSTILELTLNKHDRYLGRIETGRQFQLIHVQWQTWETNGLLFVVFPPVIAQWLEKEYTFVDWEIRRQLPPLGKALHRFLSGQLSHKQPYYRRRLLEIGETIGYDGVKKNIRSNFTPQLVKLVELDFLESFEFEGKPKSKNGLYLCTTKKAKK